MTLISDHTFSGSRFREFRMADVTVCLIENHTGKALLAFSPALHASAQQNLIQKLGLGAATKAFQARGTEFFVFDAAATGPAAATSAIAAARGGLSATGPATSAA